MRRFSTVPFKGTKEQEAELVAWLEEHKATPGVAMPALQKAQEIYGYLPIEVQRIVANTLGKPLAEIYGISTFYSQFSLCPKGEYKISVCLGTACYVKGSGKIYEKLQEKLHISGGECTEDGKFSLDACRCIGACGLAPVMTIDGEVHAKMNPDKALPCWMRSGQRRWPRNEDRNKSGADRKTRPGAGMAGRGGLRDPRVRGHGLHRGRIDEGL